MIEEAERPLHDAALAYAAAKAALANYSKGLSKEVSPKGIRVVRVFPGWVETEAAVGLVNKLAASKGIDYDGARQSLMDSISGYSDRSPGETAGGSGPNRLSCLHLCGIDYRYRICD
jgi:NAD(P)-dependent dehydrogenase (short-subunit alcohol dehydrogenase family)